MKKTKLFKKIISIVTSVVLLGALAVAPISASASGEYPGTGPWYYAASPILSSGGYQISSSKFDSHDRMFINEGTSTYIDVYTTSGAPIGDDIHIDWYFGPDTTVEKISNSRYKITAGMQGLYLASAIVMQDGVDEDVASFNFYMAVRWSVQFGTNILTLKKGKTFPMGMYTEPEYMLERCTWVSFDESVATVDQQGNIKAVGVGTTSIELNAPFYPGPVHMDPAGDVCIVNVIP